MRGIDADTLKSCYTGHNGMDDKATYESMGFVFPTVIS